MDRQLRASGCLLCARILYVTFPVFCFARMAGLFVEGRPKEVDDGGADLSTIIKIGNRAMFWDLGKVVRRAG